MKRALHFATKQNSWDIKKCDCFWVLSSARKAVLPARTANGERRPALTEEDVPRVYISFTGASVKGKGPWNYNVQPRPAGGGWVVFVGEK